MKLARSQISTLSRRAGVLATGGAATGLALYGLPTVRAQEKDQVEDAGVQQDASGVVSEKKWDEVWEEEKGSFLRPYITSVRVAAQETADDALTQWKSFKEKTDFDKKWEFTKYHTTRFYWLLTGHKLGPEIAFAATTGVLTLVATRKVLRLPFRLALLSGGAATAALLPPYDQTAPYLVDQYKNFDWDKVAAKLDPVALKDAVVEEVKASLPFGLGGSRPAKPQAAATEPTTTTTTATVEAKETPEIDHQHQHQHHKEEHKACCSDEGDHHQKKEEHQHHHHHAEHHHHDEEKEVLDVEPLGEDKAKEHH